MNVFDAIVLERERQVELKRQGRLTYTVADSEMTSLGRLAVLAEEVGEAAHEVNEGIGEGRAVVWTKLRTELIQVAAVAMGWIESDGVDKSYVIERVRKLKFELEADDQKRLATLLYFQGELAYGVVIEPMVMSTYVTTLLCKIVGLCAHWVEHRHASQA